MKDILTQLVLIIICISLSHYSFAQQGLGDQLEKVKRLLEYPEKAQNVLNDFTENYASCRYQGFSAEKCQEVATLCTSFNFATENVPGLIADIYRELQLFDTFKPRCADGKCFQCCYAGGGCHSSFIGFPVINCNYNYGADARAAGLTLITGGNPGDACLFTPQTCAHIPICLSGNTQAQIDIINNDPDHIMKQEFALQQKLLDYGTDLLEDQIYKFLNNFSTGDLIGLGVNSSNYNNTFTKSLNSNDSVLIESLILADYYNLISARGNPQWRDMIEGLETINLDQEAFGIYDDTTSVFQLGPSRLNFVRQLTMARTLTSIPNIVDRLNFTGSYIWSDSTLADYLSDIPDPDLLLESQMNPLVLHFIKNNTKLQDYRLLAVPLQDEGDLSHYYGGYQVGQPPVVQTALQKLSNNKVDLDIALFSTGTHQVAYDFEGVVYWGDGAVTHFTLANLVDRESLTHTYPTQGNYQAFTVIQNSSGLRCFKMDPVAINTNATPATTQLPILNELSFVNASMTMGNSIFSRTRTMGLNFSIGAGSNKAISAGRLAPKLYSNGGAQQGITDVDNIFISNYGLVNTDTLYIEPMFVDNPEGAYIGFLFEALQGKIYNPATKADVTIDIPIDFSKIVSYDTDGNKENQFFNDSSSGRDGFYFSVNFKDFVRIAIPLDQATIAASLIPGQATPTTDNNTYLEIKPNIFESYLLPECSVDATSMSSSNLVSFGDVIETNGIIDADDSVTLIAEESIELLENFCTQLGGEFHAKIGVCVTSNNTLIQKDQETLLASHFKIPDKIVQDETSFYFNLPVDEMEVSIKLMNMTGSLQETIVDKKLYGKGQHQFRFVKGNMSSGFYQLVFIVNGEVIKRQTLKLL